MMALSEREHNLYARQIPVKKPDPKTPTMGHYS